MTALQLKRGDTTANTGYRGQPGELTVDTELNQLRLHDGTTAGGVTVGSLTVTSVKTSAYTANAGEFVRIDSTLGGFTVTLPSNPSDGTKVAFLDVTDKCGTNPVLVAANGKTVLGDSTGINLDINGAGLSLMFNSLTNNWSKIDMFSSNFSVVDNSSSVLYSDDVFSTYLYTGNGSTQTITNGIDLAGKGGLVWLKNRGAGSSFHRLFDTARGIAPSSTNSLSTHLTNAQVNYSNGFGVNNIYSDGFGIGNSGFDTNNTSNTYVSWTFRKAAKFFDVVTYIGDGSANKSIAHALGVLPGVVMVKRTDNTGDWRVMAYSFLGGLNYGYQKLVLNTAAASGGNMTVSDYYISAAQINVGALANANMFLPDCNISGATYVAYLFAHDTSADGLIQCGSFTQNASTTVVDLGWEPQYVLLKATSTTGNWIIVDSMRGWTANDASNSNRLRANTSDAENLETWASINSRGFSFGTGVTSYIYLAIRRPNKPPTTGTQVYNAIARTGTGVNATVTGVGFAPDVIISKVRSNESNTAISARLIGESPYMATNLANSESSFGGSGNNGFTMDGIVLGQAFVFNSTSNTYINHFFKRAPGVFDVVVEDCSTAMVSHSLGVKPEMIISKTRGVSGSWAVWHKGGGVNLNKTGIGLNSTNAAIYNTLNYYDDGSSMTATKYDRRDPLDQSGVNPNTSPVVSYLFATKDGISKVGSYTGNGGSANSSGTSQTINCGFTTGARFVLIKRTDSAGDWYVWDSVRGIVSGNDPHLSLNSTAAEVTTDDSVDPDNSGFIVNQNATTNINVTNGTYIFLSFA